MSYADSDWTLARIHRTMLGFEDHGILTCFLDLLYADPGGKIGSSGQGFGGYDLRGEYAAQHIEAILKAVGVREWGDLVGKMVWAEGSRGLIEAIRGVDTGVEFRPRSLVGQKEG
jgi:hypothetical protein